MAFETKNIFAFDCFIYTRKKSKFPDEPNLFYAQKMHVNQQNSDSISPIEITRALKIHAKALNIPIILGADLPHHVNTEEYYSTLTRLSTYGNYSKYTDLILSLYRPEYYGMEYDEEGNSYKNGNCIIVAKNRNGGIGEVMLKYTPEITRFEEF